MAYQYPGDFSAFVPRATGQIISHIRDPKKYRVNQYVQLVKCDTSVGVYYKIHVDDGMRLETGDEHIWKDGHLRPQWKHVGIRHDLVEFQTVRKDYGDAIGWQTLKQADYDVLYGSTSFCRNQAMMDRTQEVITLLETAANWGGNTGTANDLNGGAGYWDTSSATPGDPNYLAIKKTLDTALEAIHLGTNGAVADFEEGDKCPFLLLLAPRAAFKISQSAEIHDYLAQSPKSLNQITGRVTGQNARWGLPEQLYGVCEVVVENAVRVSERPKTAGTLASTAGGTAAPRRFIKSNDSAVLLCRPGALDGQYNAPSFSTAQLYYTEKEMELETLDDQKNRLTEVHVVTQTKAVLASAPSGYLLTDILSAE